MPYVHLRRMCPGDLARVRRLERRCFGRNMGSPFLLRAFLADPAALGLVAEAGSRARVVGYLLLHLDAEAGEVRVCQVAVAPGHRRRGIGSRLLGWVIDHVPASCGVGIRAGVNEANLPAQLFLRANRFRAVRVVSRAARDGKEDLYLFAFQP
jgi:ribosomal protein S18 acetylase RimI-like enzyme